MNLNDFVVLPNNTAKSVKLNARNLQELKMETVTLAQESKEMEEKLQQLKESMSKEKEERGHSGGFRWKSGQSGPLNCNAMWVNAKRNKENRLQKLSAGKVKIRVLKDEPLTAPTQPPPPPLAPTMGIRTTPTRKTRLKGTTCGQCEVKAAEIMCVECTEDYCIGCFARFHQKGALKFHRIIPIQMEIQNGPIDEHIQLPLQPSQVLVVSHEENKNVEVVEEEHKGENEELPACLLIGKYDEERSARSFQEALRQWRGEKYHGEPTTQDAMWAPVQPAELSAMATQTDLSPDRGGGEGRVPVRVEFTEYSLTYMDRLLLKKHRRTPIETCHPSLDLCTNLNSLPNINIEEHTASSLTAHEQDFRQYYASLFAVPVNSGRTEPQITTESYLTIEVLDEDTDMNEVFVAEKKADINKKVPSVQQVSTKQQTVVPTTDLNNSEPSTLSLSSISPTQPSRQSRATAQTKPTLKNHPSKPQISPAVPSVKAPSAKSKPFAQPSADTPDSYKTSLKTATYKSEKPNCSPAVHKTKSGCGSPQSPALLLSPSRPLSQTEIRKSSYSPPSFHLNGSLLNSSPLLMPEEHLSSPDITCALRSTFTVSPSSSVELALLPKIYQSTPLQNSSDSSLLPEQPQSSQLYPEPITSLKPSQSPASNLKSPKQSQHSLSDPEGLLSDNQGKMPLLPVSSSPNALAKSLETASGPSETNPVSCRAPVRTIPNVSSLSLLDSPPGAYSRSRSAHDNTYEDAPVFLSSIPMSIDHESCLSYQDTQRILSVPSHLLNVIQSPPSPGKIEEAEELSLGSEDEMSSDSLCLVPQEEANPEEDAKIHQFLERGRSNEGDRGNTASPHLEDFFVPAGEERENDLQTDEPQQLSEGSMVMPKPFCHVDGFWPVDLGIDPIHNWECTHFEAMPQCQPFLHVSDPTESTEYRSHSNLSTYSKKHLRFQVVKNIHTQPTGKSDISANEAAKTESGPLSRPLSRAAQEIMEICSVDQTGCEDPDLDADTTSHTLSSLERELRLLAKETGVQVSVATGNSGSHDQQENHRFTWEEQEEEEAAQNDRESVLLLP